MRQRHRLLTIGGRHERGAMESRSERGVEINSVVSPGDYAGHHAVCGSAK
jgi:hypothetical protein